MEIIANKKNVTCLGIAGDHSIYKAQQIEDDRSNYTLTLAVTSTETSYVRCACGLYDTL